MNYLIIKNNDIVQICTSEKKLLDYLRITISRKGIIKIGKTMELPMSYNMKLFTREEVIRDIIKYQLKKIECMLQIGIYKLERI